MAFLVCLNKLSVYFNSRLCGSSDTSEGTAHGQQYLHHLAVCQLYIYTTLTTQTPLQRHLRTPVSTVLANEPLLWLPASEKRCNCGQWVAPSI